MLQAFGTAQFPTDARSCFAKFSKQPRTNLVMATPLLRMKLSHRPVPWESLDDLFRWLGARLKRPELAHRHSRKREVLTLNLEVFTMNHPETHEVRLPIVPSGNQYDVSWIYSWLSFADEFGTYDVVNSPPHESRVLSEHLSFPLFDAIFVRFDVRRDHPVLAVG
jgi:hypothetical protein